MTKLFVSIFPVCGLKRTWTRPTCVPVTSVYVFFRARRTSLPLDSHTHFKVARPPQPFLLLLKIEKASPSTSLIFLLCFYEKHMHMDINLNNNNKMDLGIFLSVSVSRSFTSSVIPFFVLFSSCTIRIHTTYTYE